jgi:DnaD/phage-associated family protein
MSPRTIGKHIRELEKDDYLRSIRPRQSEWDSTKFYRVNYVKIDATQWGSVEDTQTRTIEDAQSGTLITEVSTEETTTTTTSSEFGEICTVYEKNIGLLTPMIGDQIKDAMGDYPTSWIIEGILAAVTNEKRSWRYVLGCLKNWKREGKRNPDKKSTPVQISIAEGDYNESD